MKASWRCPGARALAAELAMPSCPTPSPYSWRPKPGRASIPRAPTFVSCAQGRTAATQATQTAAAVSNPSPASAQHAAPDAALAWDTLHVGRMPLVGFEPFAALLPGGLAAPLQLHTFVALGCSQRPDECLVLDFLPERPTDPSTALTLASGGSVSGQLRVRHMRSWIRGASVRTRLVAELGRPLSDREAREAIELFNSRWDPELRLLHNDCRHYTAALLTHLSGQRFDIEDL